MVSLANFKLLAVNRFLCIGSSAYYMNLQKRMKERLPNDVEALKMAVHIVHNEERNISYSIHIDGNH